MSLLIRSPNPAILDPGPWRDAIATLMPELEIHMWPETGDLANVEVFLAQRAEPELFAAMKNLRLMQQFGAGADSVLHDPGIPRDLPVSRLVDPHFANTMSLFVLAIVLRYHRQLDEYRRQQSAHVWKRLPVPYANERTVGIMGLGALGGDLAQKLVSLGFNVVGWSRTPKSLPGIECHHGDTRLDAFLARSEILVCLLALTAQTRGILNRDLFARLPRGAYLINVARGAHHVVADVVAALDSGQLAGATLDVHEHDPGPPSVDSPLWDHPRVDITPHVATLSSPRFAAAYVVENIRRIRAGLPAFNLVDRLAGY
jgi:glyoxylate/hydroxypyruvate reductase A